jgi:hypothetical protein
MINILRGSTIIGAPASGAFPATAAVSQTSSSFAQYVTAVILDSPNTTSATTYKVQAANTTNAQWAVNRRGDSATHQSSSITVIEVPV